jgi:hypothetical protein
MNKLTIRVLRVVLVGALAGSLFVQGVMVPLVWRDLDGADADVLDVRAPLLLIIVLGIVTTQVVMVCLWRLLTMVRRGTVFSDGAFRYVDIMIGSISCAALLLYAIGFLLAPGDVAPGVVLLIGGAATVVAGIALVVVVMRSLLQQAVAREVEASHLRAELDEVI